MRTQHKSYSPNVAQFGPHLIMLDTGNFENVSSVKDTENMSLPSTPAPSNSITSLVCDLCGTSFNHKYSLVKHTKEVHGKVTSFECKRCTEKFELHRDLRVHITTCTKDFTCTDRTKFKKKNCVRRRL